MFHVSQLHKYIPDPTHLIELEPLQPLEDLTYEEQLIEILDCRETKLHNKVVLLVKVFWANNTTAEATSKPEEGMRSKHPRLFVGPGIGKILGLNFF